MVLEEPRRGLIASQVQLFTLLQTSLGPQQRPVQLTTPARGACSTDHISGPSGQ